MNNVFIGLKMLKPGPNLMNLSQVSELPTAGEALNHCFKDKIQEDLNR